MTSEAQRKAQKKYDQSDKGKKRRANYENSEKGRERVRRWQHKKRMERLEASDPDAFDRWRDNGD